jgi:CHAT domain-containing protein
LRVTGTLARSYYEQGHFREEEALLRRILDGNERIYGPTHSSVAVAASSLATNLEVQGKFSEAEPLRLRTIELRRKSLGERSSELAFDYLSLCWHYDKRGEPAKAIEACRKSCIAYGLRRVADTTAELDRYAVSATSRYIALLTENAMLTGRGFDEGFQLSQVLNVSGTGAALGGTIARFAKGDDRLAQLAKTLQDTLNRRKANEAKLAQVITLALDERDVGKETRLLAETDRLGREVESLQASLKEQFPEFAQLTGPLPVSVMAIQESIGPDEAVMMYSLLERQQLVLWLVRRQDAWFMPLGQVSGRVAELVKGARKGMDPSDLVAVPGDLRRLHALLPANTAALHELYKHLFQPAKRHLSGVRHIFVVPVGALQALPFTTLVSSPPPENLDGAAYREIDWLANKYAFSTLPSVSSLRTLRRFGKPAAGKEPFIGFGDPLLDDEGGASRGRGNKLALRGLRMPAGIADRESLRSAGRLPETAKELRAMASTLGAANDSNWLQERATEANVKKLDLTRYRTVAFATHGFLAGQVIGNGEPGLVLTPPENGTELDDGYLTAGEIAQLKLDADWVLLSACNTAAADGTPGAEGLSGLAKAFFYAGGRTLFVSYWPVDSEATVRLTTNMLRFYRENPSAGKAEAHRQAILELINDPKHPEFAHPMYWAPFVVVGEGGIPP